MANRKMTIEERRAQLAKEMAELKERQKRLETRARKERDRRLYARGGTVAKAGFLEEADLSEAELFGVLMLGRVILNHDDPGKGDWSFRALLAKLGAAAFNLETSTPPGDERWSLIEDQALAQTKLGLQCHIYPLETNTPPVQEIPSDMDEAFAELEMDFGPDDEGLPLLGELMRKNGS